MALHKYTQEEFDALPVNNKGGKICPTGDYTKIKVFPAWSEFGDHAKFGICAKFGDDTSFEGGSVVNGMYITVGNIGSENRTAYFYRDGEGKFFVRAGCWFSGMDEFRQRVKDVHGGKVHEKTYLAACDYAVTALDAMAEEEK